MVDDQFPYNIKGNIFDNFIEKNSEIAKYPEIKEVVAEKGEHYVSLLLWSFYLYLDPRSFIFDKIGFIERENVIRRFYNPDFVPDLYRGIREFYEDRILINEDILYFVRLKRNYDIKIFKDNSFTIKKAVEELDGLIMYSKKCYGTLNMAEQYYNREKNKHPRKIEGDMYFDDFFESNPETLLFEETNKLIQQEGNKQASKIMWSFFYARDTKTPGFDKMTKEELEKRCKKEYMDIDFMDYIYIDDFYRKVILSNEQKSDYNQLKKKMDFLIMAGEKSKYSVAQASKDREILLILQDKIMQKKGGQSLLRIQGDIQPGLLARTYIEIE